MKKRSDSRGDIHKQMILGYIRTKSLNWVGVEVKDILNHIGLLDIEKHKGITRQTVNTHLNRLVAEGEIKKTRKGRYLSTDIFDDIAL
jgi:predicted transcriptional regulator